MSKSVSAMASGQQALQEWRSWCQNARLPNDFAQHGDNFTYNASQSLALEVCNSQHPVFNIMQGLLACNAGTRCR